MATKKNENDSREVLEMGTAATPATVTVAPAETALAGGGAIENVPVVITAKPDVKPARVGQPMAFDVFLRLQFGAKADQGAGFAHYVSKQKPKPVRLLKSEWEQLLKKFQNRVIGG